MIAMRGATDDEIADTFGVNREHFQAWRKLYPGMESALNAGRLRVDADVVVSLYKEATGYCVEEEVAAGKDGHIVTLKKCIRPSFSAIAYWLNNRQPDQWRSASTTSLTGGTKKGDTPVGIKVETRDELIDSIVAMLASKPDGNTKGKSNDGEKVKR